MDEDNPAACGRLLSDFSAPHSGLTPPLDSLYFSLLVGCLSTLTEGIKTKLDNKHVIPAVGTTGRASPLPSKRRRLSDVCPYGVSDFDITFLLDNGTRVPANRELVSGVNDTHRTGSEYFRGLLRGGFGESHSVTEEAIHIKGVSTCMLLPVLHYLHGCHLRSDAESFEGRDEGERSGQCQVLDTLVNEGFNVWRQTDEHSAKHLTFQHTALGELMMGACRFLVTELQRELEYLCVSVLLSWSTNAGGEAASAATEDRAEKTIPKMDRECLESAEESLATRTSELELTGLEMQREKPTGPSIKPIGQKPYSAAGALGTASDQKTIQSVSPATKSSCAAPDPEEPKSTPELLTGRSSQVKCTDLHPPEASATGAGVAALLPQIYWFSQRYNYPALGQACLSLLLGCQGCSRSLASSSLAGECLRRLAREADCTETLKQDLVRLATLALS